MLSEQGPLVVTTTKSSRNHTARSDFLLLFCFLIELSHLINGNYRLSGNLVGISINLCKSIQKELFINDTP